MKKQVLFHNPEFAVYYLVAVTNKLSKVIQLYI